MCGICLSTGFHQAHIRYHKSRPLLQGFQALGYKQKNLFNIPQENIIMIDIFKRQSLKSSYSMLIQGRAKLGGH